jgi:hypothetical protein
MLRSMSSPVEVAVAKYVALVSEPDPAVRARLIEECFAADGRLVARRREIRGRAALAEFLTQFLADPQVAAVRVTSAIDAQRTTFRYSSVVEFHDGRRLEFFDAGEIDAEGRISLLLAFAGPLGEQ